MRIILMTGGSRHAAWLVLATGFAVGAFLSTAVAAYEAGGVSTWTPTVPLIRQVESRLALPDGSKALPTYARYYYGTLEHGRRLLVGEFVSAPKQPGVHVVKPGQTPKILDGGCSVINLKYDTEKKMVIALFCDGVV
jgi:hypothetical protein